MPKARFTSGSSRRRPTVWQGGWRFTIPPKHGSWLDMAEIELNILTKQCLARRVDSIDKLQKEVAVWEKERNANTLQ